MSCKTCKSTRLMRVSAKCADLFSASTLDEEYEGYVPENIGIGGGDYVRFTYCLDCGQIQNQFPIAKTEIEESEKWEHSGAS